MSLSTVAHQRQQGLAVIRMTGCVLFEQSHGLVGAARRVQADSVDINISGPIRLKLRRKAVYERLRDKFEALYA